MKIINEKDNFLVGRKEIDFEFESEKTPSGSEVLDLISKEIKKDKSLISLRKINTDFGKKLVKVSFFLYGDLETRKKFEKIKEEKKQEEKETKEEKSEEQPKEENQEKTEEEIKNPYA